MSTLTNQQESGSGGRNHTITITTTVLVTTSTTTTPAKNHSTDTLLSAYCIPNTRCVYWAISSNPQKNQRKQDCYYPLFYPLRKTETRSQGSRGWLSPNHYSVLPPKGSTTYPRCAVDKPPCASVSFFVKRRSFYPPPQDHWENLTQ